MSMSDPLGDMLTRIRNGQAVQKETIACPWSRFRESVCQVLQDEGFIRGYKMQDLEGNKKDLVIELKYVEGAPVIRELKRVSKPGRRVYTKVQDLQPFHNGLGVTVVSTPRGVMTDHSARSANVGGEVLCQVY
ncbi:MAG: 30S ribosomal protein S8 [Alphaproteobacteria bacterium]|nr:30S ribosomal protein S8 [Alphaproteobacteria bacterium]